MGHHYVPQQYLNLKASPPSVDIVRWALGGAAALFFADLTDALAEERRVAEAQRFAELGKIAGAMAHELKSPLATVQLYANLLRRAFAHQPAAVQQLDVIKDQTRSCLERRRG